MCVACKSLIDLVVVKMLQTVFPEENADDPFASIIAKQPKIIDHNLRLEKNMTAKQKWKTARYCHN